MPGAGTAAGLTAAQMAAIGMTAAIAGAATTAVGVISQGQQAAKQGRFQQQVANRNAQLAHRKGLREVEIARVKEEDFRRRASRELASQFASGGASGVNRAAGSPLAVFSDFGRDVELEALRIRNQGDVNFTAALSQAQNFQSQGLLDRAAGDSARTSSFFRAGGGLLSDLGSIRPMGDGEGKKGGGKN